MMIQLNLECACYDEHSTKKRLLLAYQFKMGLNFIHNERNSTTRLTHNMIKQHSRHIT